MECRCNFGISCVNLRKWRVRKWENINFNNVTSVSLLKQNNVFLNIKQNGDIRHVDHIDRIQCSENFKMYIEKTIVDEKQIKGKCIGIEHFTKQALKLINCKNNSDLFKNSSISQST